jgi:hypothetical protein
MPGYDGTMIPRVCICCGEPMPESDRALADNPNLCAACSTIVDRMEDANAPPPDQSVQPLRPPAVQPKQIREAA